MAWVDSQRAARTQAVRRLSKPSPGDFTPACLEVRNPIRKRCIVNEGVAVVLDWLDRVIVGAATSDLEGAPL